MNSAFQHNLKQAVLDALGSVELSGPHVMPFGWDNRSARILAVLLEEEVLQKQDVVDHIHPRLIELGRRCFEQYQRGEYPDHTISPEAFAYALHHREFSHKEERGIRFDHGETVASFINEYNKNDALPERIFQQLITEKQSMATLEYSGSECFESH